MNRAVFETCDPADFAHVGICSIRLFRWVTHDYNGPDERNTGMDLSLDFLADFIKTQGPFEAVWGFSQGTVFLLTSLLMMTRSPV